MWIQMIGILLLISAHFIAAENDVKLLETPLAENVMRIELIEWLNEPRRYLVQETLASDLKWLKWDRSLEWLARKETCEESSSEFVQVRLQLANRTVGSSEHTFVSDLWSEIQQFAAHINKNGAGIDEENENPLFAKYYDFFRKEWTRVGCAFKTCENGMTGETTNLICFLGPKIDSKTEGPIFEQKKSAEELCKECTCISQMCQEKHFEVDNYSDDEFKDQMLNEFNDGRRAFARSAGAAAMNKLTWNEELTRSAATRAETCPKELEHTTGYKEINADLYVDYAAGLRALGDLFGSTTAEQVPPEVSEKTAFYTIFATNSTEIGCARTTKCVMKVLCHFGSQGGEGKLYEKGTACSKCSGSCENGLCVK